MTTKYNLKVAFLTIQIQFNSPKPIENGKVNAILNIHQSVQTGRIFLKLVQISNGIFPRRNQ